MKKLILVGLPALCLFVVAPMLVAVVMVALAGQAASCEQQQTSGGYTPLPGSVGIGKVQVAQANSKVSRPLASLRADLNQAISTGPDLVSLNEVARRTDRDITPAGYGMWREPNLRIRDDDGTAGLWRTDRWAKVNSRRVVTLASGPQKWDYDRVATWVTLQGTGENAAADTDSDSEVSGEGLGLSATQWKRAAEVVGAGKALGISERGILIALAVASRESGFKVYANDGLGGDLSGDQRGISRSLQLPHDAVGTDHGSLGVFQQQWPWWGSMEELMDPATSARKFYEALLKVPGWDSLPLTVAAQKVQRSAYPDAYADENLARQIYAKLANTPATGLYLASNELAVCATQTAAAGGSTVVFPVPANLAESDRHSWGEAGSNWDSWHSGTDFSVPCGIPVLASHSGTVQIDTSQRWAGPQLVKVSVGRGQLTTWYAHMQKVLVADGQAVTAGQQIGEVGEVGNATGCHLHFEVHTEGGSIYGPDNVDPSTWLAENVGKTRRRAGIVRDRHLHHLGRQPSQAGRHQERDGLTAPHPVDGPPGGHPRP